METESFDMDKHLESVLAMTKQMHRESIFRAVEFNTKKVLNLFSLAEDNSNNKGEPYCFVVCIDKGRVIGFILAVAMEHFVSNDLYCYDLLFYVEKPWRGSNAATLLIQDYKDWAEENEIELVMVGTTTGIDIDRTKRFYERNGFECVGYNFI